LRIALLTQTVPGQTGYGGIGRYTYDLARGLHERGHEVHILCRDEKEIHYESLGFVIHGLSSAETTPRPLTGQRPVLNKNLSYALAVERKLRDLYSHDVEFDVVHASNWDAEAAAIIRERVYPTALMLVTPLAQVIQTEKWPLNDDFRACIALDGWQIKHADVVCVPSSGVLKSYQTLMELDPEKIENLQIAPLGIVPDTSKLKEPIPGPNHRYKLLFVGRLEWRKGIHTLLDALPDLMQRFPHWECHLVGDDSLPVADGNTFKQLFKKKHHGSPWLDRIIFHGLVSEAELRRHYQSCDLFVAPSLF
jgi:glycosyltransferase involved in cell wall biosynthesis